MGVGEGVSGIVETWAKEFDLDRVYNGEKVRVIQNLASRQRDVEDGDYMTFDAAGDGRTSDEVHEMAMAEASEEEDDDL